MNCCCFVSCGVDEAYLLCLPSRMVLGMAPKKRTLNFGGGVEIVSDGSSPAGSGYCACLESTGPVPLPTGSCNVPALTTYSSSIGISKGLLSLFGGIVSLKMKTDRLSFFFSERKI